MWEFSYLAQMHLHSRGFGNVIMGGGGQLWLPSCCVPPCSRRGGGASARGLQRCEERLFSKRKESSKYELAVLRSTPSMLLGSLRRSRVLTRQQAPNRLHHGVDALDLVVKCGAVSIIKIYLREHGGSQVGRTHLFVFDSSHRYREEPVCLEQ